MESPRITPRRATPESSNRSSRMDAFPTFGGWVVNSSAASSFVLPCYFFLSNIYFPELVGLVFLDFQRRYIFHAEFRRIANSEPDSPRSQTTFAYARLRADILAGNLVPGERLKIADLASALEVSPGAIRKRCRVLCRNSLWFRAIRKALLSRRFQSRISKISTDLRCEIEAVALRRSVARGDSEWEASVLASAHRLRRTPQLATPKRAELGAGMDRTPCITSYCSCRRLRQPPAAEFAHPALSAVRALSRAFGAS